MADLARKKLKTPVGDAPVVPVLFIGGGMYLAWFGVHYWRSDVKYPTDPIKALLQGRPLPPRTGTPTADQQAVLNAARAQQSGAAIIGATGPAGAAANAASANQAPGVTPGTGTPGANQNTGRLLAGAYGWSSGPQWDALVKLWNQESGWNNHAENPSSGAYGIPQALPYSKMPKAAWPERYGGRSDPSAQISWGLAYIKSRYGSPEAAWAHEQANNWY